MVCVQYKLMNLAVSLLTNLIFVDSQSVFAAAVAVTTPVAVTAHVTATVTATETETAAVTTPVAANVTTRGAVTAHVTAVAAVNSEELFFRSFLAVEPVRGFKGNRTRYR